MTKSADKIKELEARIEQLEEMVKETQRPILHIHHHYPQEQQGNILLPPFTVGDNPYPFDINGNPFNEDEPEE